MESGGQAIVHAPMPAYAAPTKNTRTLKRYIGCPGEPGGRAAERIQGGVHAFAFGDLNLDGRVDLVTAHGDSGEVQIRLGYLGEESLEDSDADGSLDSMMSGACRADINFDDIPELVRFFTEHADEIGLVSFQLQAETGRGEWRAREPASASAGRRSQGCHIHRASDAARD